MHDAKRIVPKHESVKIVGRDRAIFRSPSISSLTWRNGRVVRGARLVACCGKSFAGLVRISILHTTDLHGHILPTADYDGRADLGGMARCVTQIRAWRKENPNSLLIDIGDVYQGTEFALRDQGRMMIDLFNLLRYDAWIVGNHEFDWGIEPFHQAVARSAMPVLAANSRIEGKAAGDSRAQQIFKIQPFILKGNRRSQSCGNWPNDAGNALLVPGKIYRWAGIPESD